MKKQNRIKIERLRVILKDGKKEIWFYPFKWYKYPWGFSYEPLRKDKWILEGIQAWERMSKETPPMPMN